MVLEIGQKYEGYELIACLKPRLQHTWLARGEDGKEYLLRFFFYIFISSKPPLDFPALQALNIDGYVPFSSWTYIKVGNKYPCWLLVRPYFPERLTDRFQPSPKASRALLDKFAAYAQIFEALEKALPDLDFGLSSGNLLLDGEKPILVDIDFAGFFHSQDAETRGPFWTYVEQERQIPLSTAYASAWSRPFMGTSSAYAKKIQRTDAQFAIAALYIWLRSRYLVFEDPRNPFPTVHFGTNQQSPINFGSPEFIAILKWASTISPRIRAYEERGHLDLLMISDAKEREILLKALHRDRTQAYSSPTAFVEALGGII